MPFSLCSHWLGFVSFHINYSYFCWSQLHGSAPLELPKTPGGVFIAQVGLYKEFSILFCRRGWNFPSNLTSLSQKQFLDLLVQRGVFQTGRVTQKISFFSPPVFFHVPALLSKQRGAVQPKVHPKSCKTPKCFCLQRATSASSCLPHPHPSGRRIQYKSRHKS